MSPPDSSPLRSRTLAVGILTVSLLLLAAAAQRLVSQHQEIRMLREELVTARLAHRQVAARETLYTDAAVRSKQLEEMLHGFTTQRDADAARSESQTAELERVIQFLRQEITAAEATIDRLKNEGPGAEPALPKRKP